MKSSSAVRSVLMTLAGAVVWGAAVSGASAQGSLNGPGNPTLEDQLLKLQAAVASLAAQAGTTQSAISSLSMQLTAISNNLNGITTQLTDIEDSVAPPAALATVNLTKPPGYSTGCNMVNVGTAPISIVVTMRKLDGTVLLADPERRGPPGRGTGFSLPRGFPFLNLHCTFEVKAGSPADVRAHMEIVGEDTGLAVAVAEAR